MVHSAVLAAYTESDVRQGVTQYSKKTPYDDLAASKTGLTCSQDSNTWWLCGHDTPSSHVSPLRTAGHISQSYWWVRGSRRLAFSPGCANGQEGQSWTNLCRG
jgi:hypothetical protein